MSTAREHLRRDSWPREPARGRAFARAEGGFTLTEIVVGAFIALVVLAGFVYFAVSSGHTQSLASVRVRQTSVAKAIWERVNATSAWTSSPGCSTSGTECVVTAAFYREAVADLDVDLSDLSPQVVAIGRDIAADGAADRNGAAPDVYDLKVQVNHQTSDPRRSAPVVLEGTFDPTKAGSGGSLTINVCAMLGQTDERIRVSRCSPTPATYGMYEPNPTSSTHGFELVAWEAIDDLEQIDGYSAGWMREVRVSTPPLPAGQLKIGLSGPKEVAMVPLPASGQVRFVDLPPGLYDVKLSGYSGDQSQFSRWEQGSSPRGSSVAIASGSDASAVVMLRNESEYVHVRIKQSDDWTDEQIAARWVRLLPAPAERLPSPAWWSMDPSDARAQGWMPLAELLDSGRSGTLKLQPGLYADAAIVQENGGPTEIVPVDVIVNEGGEYSGEAIWVDPRGSHYHLPSGDDQLAISFDGLEELGEEGGA
jgi:hypothetical protein